MNQRLVVKYVFAGSFGLAAALAMGTAQATICSACHTMHNSQDGATVRTQGVTPLDAPQAMLLLNDCYGCHSGINSAASIANTAIAPFVIGTADPTGFTLAGGDFWYANQGAVGDTAKGHNLRGLSIDEVFVTNVPPGQSFALSAQLECAGTNGCHGNPATLDSMASLEGAHHAPHHAIDDALTGLTIGTSFRYLKGVLGREDSDWEFETAIDHNQYAGESRTGATTAGNPGSINTLCARCHGAFHNSSAVAGGGGSFGDTYGINQVNADFSGEWIRHPTDYDMPLGASGAQYQYAAYSVEAPVGKDITAGTFGSGGLTNVGAENRIVLCVSCHRAHASPYADALRWNYAAMEVGTGVTSGCMTCHQGK